MSGHLDEDDGGRTRYLRSCAAAPGGAAAAAAAAYHHPHELHPDYDALQASEFDRYQQRPVDLGYNNRSYSPNAAAAVAAAASDVWPTHHLTHGWIEERAGQHATGLPWPPHSHEQARYMSPTTKWEVASTGVGPLSSGGGYKSKNKAKLLSPGSQGGGSGTSGSLGTWPVSKGPYFFGCSTGARAQFPRIRREHLKFLMLKNTEDRSVSTRKPK